ncbi:MAG: porin family protein [Bacteroidales bacterium]
MKKILFVVLASCFVFQASQAQFFSYGIKAGVGFSSLKMDDITNISDGTDVYDLVTGEGVTGYHVGLQTQVNLAMIVIKPEVYFNAGGGTLDRVVQGGATEALNVKFSRIDIPLLVGVKFGPARINAGPVGSYVISEDSDLTSIEPDFTLFTNSMTWGFQAGIGLDILKKVSLDARWEGSLSRLGENLTIGSNDFALDARPNQFLVSLGLWF